MKNALSMVLTVGFLTLGPWSCSDKKLPYYCQKYNEKIMELERLNEIVLMPDEVNDGNQSGFGWDFTENMYNEELKEIRSLERNIGSVSKRCMRHNKKTICYNSVKDKYEFR